MFDQRVLRFFQNAHQRRLIQRIQGNHNRQTSRKFGNQAKLHQILRHNILQQRIFRLQFRLFLYIGTKAHGLCVCTFFNNAVQTGKGAAADEQDIGSVDLQKFLMRMFAPPLRRNIGRSSFQNLQQCLLHPFPGNIPGN